MVRVLRRDKTIHLVDVWDALVAAVKNGHEAIVRLLYIDRLQIANGVPERLLCVATGSGHENVALDLLLDWPHLAPKADCHYGSALFVGYGSALFVVWV